MALIPFAFSNTLNKLVDVDEVENGKKCNCICPSCKMTLNAKQGEVNEHHFAHFSDKKAQKACAYSFWVSVRDMAKQILKETGFIHLDLKKVKSLHDVPYVFNKSIVYILGTERKNNSFDIDLITSIGRLKLGFLTPEEDRQNIGSSREYNHHSLALTIDFGGLTALKYNNGSKSFRECLYDILILRTDTKKLFSPTMLYQEKHIYLKSMVKDVFVPKHDFLIPIQKKQNRGTYSTDSITRTLYLDPRSVTYRQKNSINGMQSFFERCVKTYQNEKHTRCTSLCKEEIYEFFVCTKGYYAIADVDGIYVLYTFDDGEFNKIYSSRLYQNLQSKFLNL